MKPSLASLYKSVLLEQEIAPLLIGERANSTGSKKFRELLLADDFDGCIKIAQQQCQTGAHVIDLSSAYAGRNEIEDMTKLVSMAATALQQPLMIDSTSPECIEECLKIYPGRCIVNSVNLEDGGVTLRKILAMVKKYGAAVVALTIGENGMAMTTDDKAIVAKEIFDIATGEFSLRPSDLLFDPLTFTIGSGDESLKDAAVQTLDAIKKIKEQMPGVFTVLGVSNISFGLTMASRRILTSVFLHEAIEAGLDAAIIDVAKILPLSKIAEDDREISLDLIYNRQGDTEDSPLNVFIGHFSDHSNAEDSKDEADSKSCELQLQKKLIDGDKAGLDDLIHILLDRYSPLDVVNQILVPAMKYVGKLFGEGEILLPFVLQSAEVMKKSVDVLEPYMDKLQSQDSVKILLATVQGDVHDIGKNLVDIILSNNGYKVYNIGTKISAEMIIEKAKLYNVDIIGLSGLLVKSAMVMQQSMHQYKDAGLSVAILLGGAALTEKFVAKDCVPQYDEPVVYCRDAFAGLAAVRQFEEGRLCSTVYAEDAKRGEKQINPQMTSDLDLDVTVPEKPFDGVKYETDISPEEIFPYMNHTALFRGRWGYRRKKMPKIEYDKLIEETVIPIFEKLKIETVDQNLLRPKVAYGYFDCYSDGDKLCVTDGKKDLLFEFPRQKIAPYLCISDYFKSKEQGKDVVGFFVASIGDQMAVKAAELFASDNYHDYMITHGFGVEFVDALAEYWHRQMRQQLAISKDEPTEMAQYVTQQYRGARYGFGYPSCPDLDAHKQLFELLRPEEIGVELTENMEMVPEQSTSAIIVHHYQAKYFTV